MGKIYKVFKNTYRGIFLLGLFFSTGLKAQVTTAFPYTGNTQTFVVPPCVTTISVDARGARGGAPTDRVPANAIGGLGGRAEGVLSVVPGQLLYVNVGGTPGINGTGGFNGGGNGGLSTAPTGSVPCFGGYAGGGGGASDIRIGGTALANRIIVAGGGGGAGRDYCGFGCPQCGCGGGGGAGGSLSGVNGQPAYVCSGGTSSGAGVNYGSGGTGIAGGVGGPQDPGTGLNAGTAGVLGIGGAGSPGQDDVAGGGGGGGYYGGGGGGGAVNGSAVGGGGGGGGSSYFSGLTNTITTQAFQNGAGYVAFSYFVGGAPISVVATPSIICVGSSSTLTASGFNTYTWNPGGSNSNSIIVTPALTSNYTVSATDVLGCTSTSVLAVIVSTVVPSLTVVGTPSVLCAGNNAIITASGANSYTWTNGITNGVAFAPAATATYVVTADNGCGTGTAAISITVNPNPNITASVNTPTICSGNSVVFNGGGSTTGYTWSGGVVNNSPFFPNVTGNYVVTGGSVNGCSNTAVAGIIVIPTPTISPVATPTAICLGVTATLSAGGATGFTWTPGTALYTQSITVSPPVSTTYTLVRTNGPCSSTTNVNLVVNPLPVLNASATPSLVCAGNSVNLASGTGPGAMTYTWLPGGFSTSSLTLYPNLSTNYTITVSNGNCTATAVLAVSVNPNPTITLTSSTLTICQGNSVTLSAGGGQTYTWQPMNTNNPVELVSPATTTSYTLMGTNSYSCMRSQSLTITVKPLPTLNLSSSVPFICAGQSATLSVNSPSNGIFYNWSINVSGSSIVVSPGATTNYVVTALNTITGCQNSNTITLTAYIATFVVTSPTAICTGGTATLTAIGPATTYSWSANGGVVMPSVMVSPTVTTSYFVTGINASCSTSTSVQVIVNPLPGVTATAKSTICKFEIATITGNGATTYSWNTGATTPAISFTLSVTTTYTVTGTDINGCSNTATVTQFVATCIGMDERETNGNSAIHVYPNPNNGSFIINSDVNITLSIVNALGQLVNTVSLNVDNQKKITVNNLPEGIYFITGETNGFKVNTKFIVER